MNYIKEINAFYDWLETNSVPDSAIVLWHALMHISSKTGWAPDFAVAISTLSTKTGLKKDAIIRARHRLQQVGRIDFASRSGQQSAVYRIIPFVSEIQTQSATQSDSVGLADANRNTNRAQTATQSATQTASIIISSPTPLKDPPTTSSYANAFVMYEKEGFGLLTGTIRDTLGDLIDDYTDDWVQAAMRESVLSGVRSMKYVQRILERFKRDGPGTSLNKRDSSMDLGPLIKPQPNDSRTDGELRAFLRMLSELDKLNLTEEQIQAEIDRFRETQRNMKVAR